MTTRAFTTIELLAATALTAVLMLALLAATAAVGRTRTAFARQEALNPWPPALAELIRWDLANARTMRRGKGQVILTGVGAVDPADLSTTHRPVTVVYSVQVAGRRSWLVRQQTLADLHQGQQRWSEIACAGIESFDIQPVRDGTSASAPESGYDQSIPPRLRLTVTFDDGAKPLDQVILLQ